MKKLILVYLVFVTLTVSGQGVQWVHQFGGNSTTVGRAIVRDGLGNIYVTGQFHDTVDFDPGTAVVQGIGKGTDVFISRFSDAGGLLWSRSLSAPYSDDAYSIGVDDAGNIYVSGFFADKMDFDPGADTFFLNSGVGFDVFVVKLSSSGDFIWARQIGGPLSDHTEAMTVDPKGNVYVAGTFNGTCDFDPGPGVYNLTAANKTDVFVARLDSSGELVWAKSFFGNNYDYGYAIATDASGNVYCAGLFQDTVDMDPGPGKFEIISAGFEDIFLCSLDPAGNFRWAARAGGSGSDEARSVATDGAGNVYITGGFGTTVDFDPGPGTINLTASSIYDVFLWKMGSNGQVIWARSMGGKGWQDIGSSVKIQGDEIYLAGRFRDTADFDPGPSSYTLISHGDADHFVSRLDTSGKLSWAISFPGSFDAYYPPDLCVDTLSHVYVTGAFRGPVDFQPGPDSIRITPPGHTSAFVWKFNQCNTSSVHTLSSCGNVVSPSGKYVWSSSGTYFDTIPNGAGCDSVIEIHLAVKTVDVSVSTDSLAYFTLRALADSASYQWMYCDSAIIQNENGQSFTAQKNHRYAVIVTQNGCIDTSACYAIQGVGFGDPDQSFDARVYPNPNNGEFTLYATNFSSEAVVTIRAINGQLLSSRTVNLTEPVRMEINEAPGIYLLEIATGEGEKAVVKIHKK